MEAPKKYGHTTAPLLAPYHNAQATKPAKPRWQFTGREGHSPAMH